MSEVLENAMLSLVESMEKVLPRLEKLTAENVVIVGENKVAAETLITQFRKLPPVIQALHKHAEKVEEIANRVGEVKIPEEVKVYKHVRHSTEPVTLKFLWVFFSVSVLFLAGAGFWVYHTVSARDAAVKVLQDYQSAYKPERVKWLYDYSNYMAEKHPADTKAYIKGHGSRPDN